MPTASYDVLIDWLGDSGFTGTSDNVTANVRFVGWKRGRDYASQLNGR